MNSNSKNTAADPAVLPPEGWLSPGQLPGDHRPAGNGNGSTNSCGSVPATGPGTRPGNAGDANSAGISSPLASRT